MLFTGTYERSLDEKGRVLLPKPVRKLLMDCDSIFVTPGTESCLQLHTNHSLESLARKAVDSASSSRTIQSFSRLFYAQAEKVDVDGQSRIRIPARLCQWAELSKDVVIVGVGFNWEIWDQERWQEFMQAQQGNFDWVHELTFDARPGDEFAEPAQKSARVGVMQEDTRKAK